MSRSRLPFEIADLVRSVRWTVGFVCVAGDLGACAALQGLDQYENCVDETCGQPPSDESGTPAQDAPEPVDAPHVDAPGPSDAKADGYADAEAEAGCGDTQSDRNNCGVCGRVCPVGFACTSGNCTCAFTACGSDAGDAAGLFCTNTQTDVQNCGGCGAPCALSHAAAKCTGAQCAIDTCNTNFVNCDGVAANGCECASDSCLAGNFCAKRVFVTSVRYDGNLGGLVGADAKCQTLAVAAGLPGTYKAWLSDPVASPSTRFAQATIPYRLVDGTLIANNWADLIDGTLANAITKTEAGLAAPTATFCYPGETVVWSSTTSAGVFDATVGTCANWTDANGTSTEWGHANATSASWAGGGCSGSGAGICTGTFVSPIYCFQQ